MINHYIIYKILQAGITINNKRHISIQNVQVSKKFNTSDIIFITANNRTEKQEKISKLLLNTLPFFINSTTRTIGSNFLLERLIEKYEIELNCNLSLKSCLYSSHLNIAFSKEQKEEIQEIYNSFKPEFISLKYWNNDFIRLLEEQNNTEERIKIIKKQLKSKRLIQCPEPPKKPKKKQKIYLNIESTGINETSEIVQLSITKLNGDILFNELIKPNQPIEEGATYVNGLKNNMLNDCRTWKEIAPEVKKILKNKIIFSYKSDFDKRLIQQSSLFNNVDFNVDDYHFLNTKDYLNPAHIVGKEQREEIAGQSQKDKDYYENENSWKNYYENY